MKKITLLKFLDGLTGWDFVIFCVLNCINPCLGILYVIASLLVEEDEENGVD